MTDNILQFPKRTTPRDRELKLAINMLKELGATIDDLELVSPAILQEALSKYEPERFTERYHKMYALAKVWPHE